MPLEISLQYIVDISSFVQIVYQKIIESVWLCETVVSIIRFQAAVLRVSPYFIFMVLETTFKCTLPDSRILAMGQSSEKSNVLMQVAKSKKV